MGLSTVKNHDSRFSLVTKAKFQPILPRLSIVIPFFNREFDLNRNLNQLLSSLQVPCELILIDDSSEDNTLELLSLWVKSLPTEQNVLVEIRLYNTLQQQFETRCDHFGIEVSQADFVLGIQADMLIQDVGFDNRYLKAMKTHRNLIAISGRGCHTFNEIADAYKTSMGAATFDNMEFFGFLSNRLRTFLRIFLSLFITPGKSITAKTPMKVQAEDVLEKIYPPIGRFEVLGRAGRLGNLIEFNDNSPEEFKDLIWISDTVMRGPLLIDKAKYLELGGFNLDCFFLGYDEHDLFFRAAQHGYRCGYVPINFDSPLNAGSTRSRRTGRTELALTWNVLRIQCNRRGSALKRMDLGAIRLDRLIESF